MVVVQWLLQTPGARVGDRYQFIAAVSVIIMTSNKYVSFSSSYANMERVNQKNLRQNCETLSSPITVASFTSSVAHDLNFGLGLLNRMQQICLQQHVKTKYTNKNLSWEAFLGFWLKKFSRVFHVSKSRGKCLETFSKKFCYLK